jgi:hypothetical protein
MSDNTVMAEWPLNKREHLRVSIENYNGFDLINVRKWFKAEDDTLRPGKQGIAIQVKHLPQLADAMTKALTVARDRGLVAAQPTPESENTS